MNFLVNIPLLYTLLFCGTLIFSVLINELLLNFSKNLGTRKNNSVQIRWNSTAKPALGGLSFYIVFLFAFIFLEIITQGKQGLFSTLKIVGLLCSVTAAFLMGMADDAYDTKPLVKFIIQCVCGIILISTGTKINTFESEFLNYALTLIWVVALMNSINMLDNMDGISTITTLIICLFVVVFSVQTNLETQSVTLIGISVIGSLCGFLVYNWHPSKMFMGDSGSQFLGIFLAFCGIEFCWNTPVIERGNFPVMYPLNNLIVVALVFIMPLTDTIIVVINRILKGSSPFVGGKDHTTHCLFYYGITEKKIALTFFMINIIGAGLALLLINQSGFNLQKALIFSIYPVALFSFLLYLTRRKQHA
jgi:UDP-GlcNAc:undecaprenyl-phosphate/decaprenyl-phosphate GlcNAc-1-phosphate transferase